MARRSVVDLLDDITGLGDAKLRFLPDEPDWGCRSRCRQHDRLGRDGIHKRISRDSWIDEHHTDTAVTAFVGAPWKTATPMRT